MPATTTASQFSRITFAVAAISSKKAGVISVGRCNQPKKSLPGHVPFSKASCASFTFGSKAFTAPLPKKQAAFVMSNLMLLIFSVFYELD